MRRLYTMKSAGASQSLNKAKTPATPRKPSKERIVAFVKTVRAHYRVHGRHFPWRDTYDPYHILVSEIMLQQTQADRVVDFFNHFINKLPTVTSLARASASTLITLWKGLGYNRRALQLQQCAQVIVEKYNGIIPHNYDELVALPGIGPATAGDILAFAFDKPAVVIETNIRTAIIYFFFSKNISRGETISEEIIRDIVMRALPKKHIREWYAGLMDYGAMIKKTEGNFSRHAGMYSKQKTFKGSSRELRAALLFYINEQPRTERALMQFCENKNKALAHTLPTLLSKLNKEGFIMYKGKTWYIRHDER